jgi:DNA-binding NarL/FixJ family response regulator
MNQFLYLYEASACREGVADRPANLPLFSAKSRYRDSKQLEGVIQKMRAALQDLGFVPNKGNEAPFSDREMAILHHLAEGADNKLIAYDLDISEAALYAHIKELCRKLGVETRAQAAVWARDHEQQ